MWATSEDDKSTLNKQKYVCLSQSTFPGSERKNIGSSFLIGTDVVHADVIGYRRHHRAVFPRVVDLSPPRSFPILQHLI